MQHSELLTRIFLFLGMCLPSLLPAQFGFKPFQKYVGGINGDGACCITPLTDSSLMVGAITNHIPPTEGDALFLEIDLSGKILSSQQLDHGKREIYFEVLSLPSENLIVVGNTTQNDPTSSRDDLAVCKIDRNGSLQWSKFWGAADRDDQLHSAILTKDHQILLVGMSAKGGEGRKALIIKMDTMGIVSWSHTFVMGSNREQFWRIIEANQGYYISGGSNQFDPDDYNPFLAYFKKDGTLLFAKVYDEGSPIEAGPISNRKLLYQVNDNSFFLAESIRRGGGDVDILLTHVDSTGNPFWSRTYDGSGEDVAYFCKPANDGNILIGGSSTSFGDSTSQDALLFKIDPMGNVLWAHTYGGDRDDRIQDIQGVSRKGASFYIAVGVSNSFNIDQSSDIYLLGVQEDGSGFRSCYTRDVPLEIENRTVQVSSAGVTGIFSLSTTHTTTLSSPNLQTINTSCDPFSTSIHDWLEENIEIYPIPAFGEINVEVDLVRLTSLRLFDLSGREIDASISLQHHRGSLSTSYQGFALLHIQTNEGLLVKKVLFQ